MTSAIIASAILWSAVAASVAAVTLLGASISHVRDLVAERRRALVAVAAKR